MHSPVRCVSTASQKAKPSPLQLHGSRHVQSDSLCAGVKALWLQVLRLPHNQWLVPHVELQRSIIWAPDNLHTRNGQ